MYGETVIIMPATPDLIRVWDNLQYLVSLLEHHTISFNGLMLNPIFNYQKYLQMVLLFDKLYNKNPIR
jgi:hypothetical protein